MRARMAQSAVTRVKDQFNASLHIEHRFASILLLRACHTSAAFGGSDGRCSDFEGDSDTDGSCDCLDSPCWNHLDGSGTLPFHHCNLSRS